MPHTSRLVALLLPAIALAYCGGELEGLDDWAGDEAGWERNDGVDYQRMAACPSGGKVQPGTPSFGASIDGYASYVGQSSCSGSAKPGVEAFKNLVLATYPCTHSGGIVRGCSIGGKSEHKEGRAWDWMLNYPHPAADSLLAWLLATDKHGNKHAMARRLGIMYMIWNRRIWKSYQASKGWQHYSGSNPHTDHIHFSFSWAGARKETSFFKAAPAAPTPAAPPPDPGHPQMSITSRIRTIDGQARDACKISGSAGIYDWWVDQKTSFEVDVKNGGTAVAKNVRIGLTAREPHVRVTRWSILTNWKTGGKFVINDTNAMQTIPHASPGKSFTLWLGAMSPGETKRILLTVQARKESLDLSGHAYLRSWVAHVDACYDKPGYGAAFTNVGGLQKQNSGNLRHVSKTDVMAHESCDGRDNDCDGQVDEGGVCPTPPPPEPPPPPAPAPDSGPPPLAPDSGVPLPEADGGPYLEEPDPYAPTSPMDPVPDPPAEDLTVEGSCSVAVGARPAGASGILLLLALLLVRRRRG